MSETADEYVDYYRTITRFGSSTAFPARCCSRCTHRRCGGEGSPDNGLAAIDKRRFFVLT